RDRSVVAELLLLEPPHVPVRTVVDDDRDQPDPVLDGGGQLVAGEEEATVAAHRYRLAIAQLLQGVLRAEGMRVTGAQGAGRTGRQERPRVSEIEHQVGREPELSDVLDE